jgi:serine/threonine protein phosphatase PrpC
MVNGASAGAAAGVGRDGDAVAPSRVGRGKAVLFSMGCPGLQRRNEDSGAILPINDRRGVLVVADGCGGRPAGESASKIAVRTLASHVSDVRNGASVRAAILDAIDEANHTIIDLGIGAGTTAAVVEIDGDRIRGYHVGDSRILVVGQRGRVKFQTLSHAPIAYAVESGLLDEREALQHEDRHLVSNVIGDADMRIEIGSWLRLAHRDTLLLATDGVFDNLHPHEVIEAIRAGSLEEAAERLAQTSLKRMNRPATRAPSKPDDLTFILYRADATPASSRSLRTCA